MIGLPSVPEISRLRHGGVRRATLKARGATHPPPRSGQVALVSKLRWSCRRASFRDGIDLIHRFEELNTAMSARAAGCNRPVVGIAAVPFLGAVRQGFSPGAQELAEFWRDGPLESWS